MRTDAPAQQATREPGPPEIGFKAQLELHNSCQGFASEILRLCLGGIAVVGFLLPVLSPAGQGAPSPESLGNLGHTNVLADLWVRVALLGSTLALGLGSAFSLYHKYCESSALYYHLRAQGMQSPTEEDCEDPSIHRSKQTTYFRRGQRFLSRAARCLVVGTAMLIPTFVRFIWLRS